MKNNLLMNFKCKQIDHIKEVKHKNKVLSMQEKGIYTELGITTLKVYSVRC